MEETHKNHQVQSRAPPKTQTQCLRVVYQHSLSSGSSGPCLLPWGAVPCPMPSEAEPFPNPPIPPLTHFHAVPSGPVVVTESRAQRCPPLPVRSCSCHEASLSLLCSGPNKPRGLSCSSYLLPFKPFTIFAALLWTLSNSFTSFLYCSAQTCTQYSRRGHTEHSGNSVQHHYIQQQPGVNVTVLSQAADWFASSVHKTLQNIFQTEF